MHSNNSNLNRCSSILWTFAILISSLMFQSTTLQFSSSFSLQRASTAKRKDGCVLADRHLQTHGAEFTPKSNMKSNPLFTATRSVEQKNQAKVQPSWTIKEYKTQSLQWAQQDHVKVRSSRLEINWSLETRLVFLEQTR